MKNIDRVTLRKDVIIKGSNIFGLPASIELRRSNSPGWYLLDKESNYLTQLNNSSMIRGIHTIFGVSGTTKMYMIKNIIALRDNGLDCVILSGSTWPPYLSAQDFRERVRPFWGFDNTEIDATNPMVPGNLVDTSSFLTKAFLTFFEPKK